MKKGFLIDYLKILGGKLKGDSKVRHKIHIWGFPQHLLLLSFILFQFERLVVTTFMSTLLHCVQLPEIKVYYNLVDWSKVTTVWALSVHQELRLLTRFVLGFVTCSPKSIDKAALHFDVADAVLAVDLLQRSPLPNSKISTFYCNIDTTVLLHALNHLLVLTIKHPSLREVLQELVDVFDPDSIIAVLVELISRGIEEEQIKSFEIIWTLSEIHHTCKPDQIYEVIDIVNVQSNVNELFHCVLYSMDHRELKGNSYACNF